MKLVVKCPHCAESIDLVQAAAEEDLRKLAYQVGCLGQDYTALAWRYLMLFRAPGAATLPRQKCLRAAEELNEIARNGRFRFGHEDFPITRLELLEGLRRVVDANPSKLKDNNYLKSALANLSGTEEARRAASRPPAQAAQSAPQQAPQAAGQAEKPGDLAAIAENYVRLVRGSSPMAKLGVAASLKQGWRASLAAAGVDLEQLDSLARAVKDEHIDGESLLRRCRASGGLKPVGEVV